ncbi:MAG TPA: IS1634 family transposase [Crocinitomix sp.]|nr:IS1634 family transposase [Crocinitomix sp.]
MAFIRVEKKQSGTYLRIVQSYKENGKPKHKTLHSLGKVEDYPPNQLEAIAKKLLALSGINMKPIVADSFHEVGRYNYGYALVVKKLFDVFKIGTFIKRVNVKRRIKFNWGQALHLMVAERLNDPVSKLQNSLNQEELIGISEKTIPLHHLYRALDVLAQEQEFLKEFLFEQQQNLFTQNLDVVFYDVTTLYFESQIEEPDCLRQKGYSKDGKAHKTQVVLGLLVDKLRNPISYQIYKGNTYEGGTMPEALKRLKDKYRIDQVIVVADSAMIDQSNQEFIAKMDGVSYIIGDSIKVLPKKIKTILLDREVHKSLDGIKKENFSYHETTYKGRRIICTYSAKRARKSKIEREKLINKAQTWINQPSKYSQTKKRGAGKYIVTDKEGDILLNTAKINKDAMYDGFKAIATTTDIPVSQILEKYRDLWQVERAFRTLKSQLEIRPMFHWTDKRIEGHVAMCFLSFLFLNYLRNLTKLSEKEIVKTLDLMQLSAIKHNDDSKELMYMRSKSTDNQDIITKKLKIVVPKEISTQSAIYQCIR